MQLILEVWRYVAKSSDKLIDWWAYEMFLWSHMYKTDEMYS